ncbi:MAG TPA: ComEC/Rec2 family competence protein, partial [Bacteroidia bacterium]|nr:ComEC/Rec2 family competence protein [Bacteroidia bacterium]
FWFGLLINFSFFVFAYQLTIYKTQKFSVSHFSNHCRGNSIVYARLADSYIEKEKSLKTIIEILAVKENDEWKKCTGKAMVYLKTDSLALALKYGDELLLNVNFKEVPQPQNPGEFNYKRFLSFHNIYNNAYVKSDEWKSLKQNSGNPILKYSIGLRNDLLDVLKQNHLNGDELSVGAALLLGYTDKLDADLISAYSSTGALHVLSVSGLHVAIVYIVFSWLLVFLDRHKKGRIIKAILLILFLWFYAALTGLSPSVLRAATMFSFIIVAKATNKHTNIYNTLAASALFLLLINPYLIMEVGFQLSYLAVIGIVYIQPKIYEWFEFDNWLLDQVWMITAVSIAAQIATFPLGLHYFHQFPNYFLLSNLIVIPVSTLIIYVGIALFSFSTIPLFVKYLAIVFTWLIWFLNVSVKWIESLPYSLLQGISISVFETWLLYGLIILFLFYLSNRKYYFLIYSLSFCVFILISQVVEQQIQFNQKKIVVYNVAKTTAIDFVNSKQNVLLTDSVFAKNDSRLLFHVKHNWWDLGMNNSQIISENFTTENLIVKSNFIQFFDKRLFVLNKVIKFKKKHSKKLNLDYLVISNNTKMRIEDVQQMFRVKMFVFDSSNSEYKIKKWKEECEELNQEYCSTMDAGALEINLD